MGCMQIGIDWHSHAHDSYHSFYVKAKGNQFKNKRVIVEAIHKVKAERLKSKALEEQSTARKEKAKLQKEKKASKKEELLKSQQ